MVEIAIENHQEDSLVVLNEMIYFRGMCNKQLYCFEEAEKDYMSLQVLFNQFECKRQVNNVINLVILAMETQRKK